MYDYYRQVLKSANDCWQAGYDEGFKVGYKKAKEEVQNDNKSKRRVRRNRDEQE